MNSYKQNAARRKSIDSIAVSAREILEAIKATEEEPVTNHKTRRLKEALSATDPRDIQVAIDNLAPTVNSLLLDHKVSWKDTYRQPGESQVDFLLKLASLVPEQLAARTLLNAMQVTERKLTAAQSRKETKSTDDRVWKSIEAETQAEALELRASDMGLSLAEKAQLRAEAAAYRQRARELAGG